MFESSASKARSAFLNSFASAGELALKLATSVAMGTTIVAGLALLAAPLHAAWEVDNERSRVSFVSVKNGSIGEVHHFRSIAGGIDDDGGVQLLIDLDSVETLIPIRNQRLRELLFETVRFPAATLTAAVPAELLALEVGASESQTMDFTLDLHGRSVDYSIDVAVNRGVDGSVHVALLQPLVVRAQDFELESGIETLREVAGLKSITTAVPVSARLVFSTVPLE